MSRSSQNGTARRWRAAGVALGLWLSASIASASTATTTVYRVLQNRSAGLAFSMQGDASAGETQRSAPASTVPMGGEVALSGRPGGRRGPVEVRQLSLLASIPDGVVSIGLDPSKRAMLRPASTAAVAVLSGEIAAFLTIEGQPEPIPIVLSARGRHGTADARLIDFSLVVAGLEESDGSFDEEERIRQALAALGLAGLDGPERAGVSRLERAAVTAVPEPGTSLLLGLGLAGLAGVSGPRRRRLEPGARRIVRS